MRDVVAFIVAVALLVVAASLATALRYAQVRRQRARDSERALGRAIVVELPAEDDLVIFSEDPVRFYYGERSIDKDLITGVRLLVNGAALASTYGTNAPRVTDAASAEIRPPEPVETGIIRDRWDVEIETETGRVTVECGAIRERVSQELGRAIFDAVSRAIVARR
jgi:hypothetical protein